MQHLISTNLKMKSMGDVMGEQHATSTCRKVKKSKLSRSLRCADPCKYLTDIPIPFHIYRLVKALPFHMPEDWKRYPLISGSGQATPGITPEGHEIFSTVLKKRTLKLNLRVKTFSFFTTHLKWIFRIFQNFKLAKLLVTISSQADVSFIRWDKLPSRRQVKAEITS